MMASALSATTDGNTPQPTKGRYRPEIDGLRAFAVVAVIINHFNKELLPSGYLGVDIFFVISGYVITSSLAGRQSKNFLDFVTGFYERRIKRLVPALVVFVLVTSVLISLFNPDPGVALGLGWRSLFGISNINLYQASTDYFAESTELNPFTHTWSLGVEEQFYLLFPFLIWFSGFGRQTATGARNLFLWVGALTIASLIGFIYLYQVNQPAAYFLMPPRFWEMAAGCLIFIGFQKRARIEQALEQVPPLLVVTAMVGVMFLPISAAVPATIGIVVLSAILIACLKEGTAAYKFFTFERFVYVGLISYSLYLWHWTVLSISRWTIGIHWWSVPIQAGLMFLAAVVSYNWIETPARRKIKFSNKFQAPIIAGIALSSLAALIKVFGKVDRPVFIGDINRGELIFAENRHWKHKECMNYRLFDWIPSDKVFADCWIKGQQSQRLNQKTANTRVFAYGDSYNEQLTPAYYALSRSSQDVRINAFVSSGCPASEIISFSGEKNLGHCSRVFKNYLKWFWRNSGQGDILVIANSPHYFFKGSGFQLYVDGERTDQDKALLMYLTEIKKLSWNAKNNGRRVIIVSGIPALKGNPDVCSQWFASYNDKCRKDNLFDLSNSSESKRIADRLSNLAENKYEFIDIFGPMKRIASGAPNPYLLYYNPSHLSRAGAFSIAHIIKKAILGNRSL